MSIGPFEFALPNCTLRAHGDPTEQSASTRFDLDRSFDQYEMLWRYHVVPCTNRPRDIGLRIGVAKEREQIIQLNHGIWCDLAEACENLANVQAGDVGNNFKQFRDCMKNGGNAMQKFSELQQAVEGPRPNNRDFPDYWLAKALGCKLTVIPKADWDTAMKPRRETNISYRNFLVHGGNPPVMVDQSANPHVYYVLKSEHLDRDHPPSWADLSQRYAAAPQEWERMDVVCKGVHEQTIAWLNDGYRYVNACLLNVQGSGMYRMMAGALPPAVTPSRDMFDKPQMPTAASGVTMFAASTAVQPIPKKPPDNCTS